MSKKLLYQHLSTFAACLCCMAFFLAYSSPVTHLIKYYHTFTFLLCGIAVLSSFVASTQSVINLTILDLLAFIFIALVLLNILLTYSININLLYPLQLLTVAMLYIAFRQNKQVRIKVVKFLPYVLMVGILYGVLEVYIGGQMKWMFFNSTLFANFIVLMFNLCVSYLIFQKVSLNNLNHLYRIWAGVVILFGVLIFIYGRISIFTFLLSILSIVIFSKKLISRKGYVVVSVVLAVILLFFCVSFFYFKVGSATGRLFVWNRILENSTQMFSIGNGFGQFRSYFTSLMTGYWDGGYELADLYKADIVEFAFNDYLQLFVEGGILLLSCYLLLVCYATYVSFKNRSSDVGKSNLIFPSLIYDG